MKAFYKSILFVVLTIPLAFSATSVRAASDDANDPAYTGGWDANSGNGGTGFLTWVGLETTQFGRGFIDGAPRSISTVPLASTNSWALFSSNFASNQVSATARPLAVSLAIGTETFIGRFDVDNSVGFTGFDIKSTVGTTFGDGQLLSWGLTPGSGNSTIFVTGATTQSITLGSDELRGAILGYTVSWDTTAGTYTLSVTNLTGTTAGTVSGSLQASGSPVDALGFANFNSGNNQNVIFNDLNVVPEPSTLALVGLGLICGFAVRRRKV
jgi:hypothetical protein